jgi:neutral ceramidase
VIRANDRTLSRRHFLERMAAGAAAAGLSLGARRGFGAAGAARLLAGEGVVDTTPPLGIEMGGFHRPPDNPRLITGIRQPTSARALWLACGDVQAAVVSLDMLDVSYEFTGRVQAEVARETGIPASHVRVCATHSHSMPAFQFSHQWGAVPQEYMAAVAKKVVEACRLAKEDLAPAEVYLGKARAVGANFNRTTKKFKTDAEFTKNSTEDERWLDTMLHVLRLERPGGRRTLAWYHFSNHPVCFRDSLAGPDWPGLVAKRVAETRKVAPVFLQGHAGDVNPGDGTIWIGEAEPTAAAVCDALGRALDDAKPVKVDALRVAVEPCDLPLDMALFKTWLDEYRKDPAACKSGPWVDAGFAKAWFESASKYDLNQTALPITLAAMRLGEVGMVFHPAEMYSCYGLAIRRDSPLADTLVVGYADGTIGYGPDVNAYKAGEYAAVVVPKILDYPPLVPTATQTLAESALGLLAKVAG